MWVSGFRISTPEGRSMSPEVTSPGPVTTSGASFSAEIWGVWNSIMGDVLRVGGRARSPLQRARLGLLLGVQLDDQLLLHRSGDLVAVRCPEHLGGQSVVVRLQPSRHDGDQ